MVLTVYQLNFYFLKASVDSPTATRRRRGLGARQMTLPAELTSPMSYLQVPGQEKQTFSR